MKLNLGCGPDIRPGYINVDFNPVPGIRSMDLSKLPWDFKSNSVDEILMLDILEHFPYNFTESVLKECFRIMKPGARIEIQVPDFEHCALAALDFGNYMCNVCGKPGKAAEIIDGEKKCISCGTSVYMIGEAAIHRLYGGQNFEGNWHFNAFTKSSLCVKLDKAGFKKFELLEKHHQMMNWNFKISAIRGEDV